MEQVYRQYKPMIYRIALTRVRHTADAEDITQEVLLQYLRSRPAFDNAEHEKAWLIRTTIDRSTSLLRAGWRKRTEPPDETAAAPPFDSDLQAAMLSLPETTRTLLYLFHFERMDIAHIAQAMSLSQSAVKKRLTRGRDKLKAILGGDEDDLA